MSEASDEIDARGRLRYRLLLAGILPPARLLFRIRVAGRGNVPRSRPYIVVANHGGWLDIPALLLALPPRPRVNFLADPTFLRTSRWKRLVTHQVGGVLPIPDAPPGAGWRLAARCIERGAPVVFFAEGRFEAREGRLLRFHRGFAWTALHTGAPVVPVGISGTHDLWLRKRVLVRIGAAIEPAGMTRTELVEAARAAVERLLAPVPARNGRRPLGGVLTRLFSTL